MQTRTNIVLDDEVIEEAKKLTSLKTKKEVIDFALRELINHFKRKKLIAIRRKGLWQGNLSELRRKRVGTN
ncbi:MAG: type II toxin-antitoxin system VapB family antitoxin [Nitrospirae bacterium]|nr:type II toxin-antitoxin system VapB family antitoxin [Nitrospirota bacterium]